MERYNKRVFNALRSALLDIFFTENIASYHVDSAAETLARLEKKHIKTVLDLTRLIAFSVSEILAFSFIENVGNAIQNLDYKGLEDWVKAAIQIYESEGLQPAKEFFEKTHETSLSFGLTSEAASFEQVVPSLLLLAVSLTGREVRFKTGSIPWTDTNTIFAPRTWNEFPQKGLNELFFRVAITHKCFQIANHSLLLPKKKLMQLLDALNLDDHDEGMKAATGLEALFISLRAVSDQEDIAALYSLVETIRNENIINKEYPGLSRDLKLFKEALREFGSSKVQELESEPGLIVKWVASHYSSSLAEMDIDLQNELADLTQPKATSLDSALCTSKLLKEYRDFPWAKAIRTALPYVGTIFPKKSAAVLLKRRQECKDRFVEIMATLVIDNKFDSLPAEEKQPLEESSCPVCSASDVEEAIAMVIVPGGKKEEQKKFAAEPVESMKLKGQGMELLEELKTLLKEIEADMGEVPTSYVSGAADLASGSYSPVETRPDDPGATVKGNFVYDEWDFRRQAYRKNWCSLKEKLSTPAAGDFIETTLARYRGQILMLRRQFEALRQDNKILRRQKEGDDIDIEAAVEAYTDFLAGATPKENLFVRHYKADRNIAVAFLVDMSASTEGWTNRAIKESLVLLCESLEVLGDRYAIFGFSGMRRTSCQFYMIKDFREGYTKDVQERITGISPKDYTRMGPAIRHTIYKFSDIEAKLKLLITLTDGKPEDYDEYKGPYAIEDTRAALIEAKNCGIRPFCITIDKEARDYLPRMYGEVNYTLVKDVDFLHKRLPEMYRLLTT